MIKSRKECGIFVQPICGVQFLLKFRGLVCILEHPAGIDITGDFLSTYENMAFQTILS